MQKCFSLVDHSPLVAGKTTFLSLILIYGLVPHISGDQQCCHLTLAIWKSGRLHTVHTRKMLWQRAPDGLSLRQTGMATQTHLSRQAHNKHAQSFCHQGHIGQWAKYGSYHCEGHLESEGQGYIFRSCYLSQLFVKNFLDGYLDCISYIV